EGHAVDVAELGLVCGAAVAGEPLLAGAGERGNLVGVPVVLADAAVEGVRQIDTVIRTDREAVHAVEGGLRPGAAIPVIALDAFLARECRGLSVGCDHSQRLAFGHLAEENCLPLRSSEIASERLAELGFGGFRAAAAAPAAGDEDELVGAG